MSSIKLLTHASVRTALNFGHQQYYVRSAFVAPFVTSAYNSSTDHTNCYNNYLITRNRSQCAASEQPVKQFPCTKCPIGITYVLRRPQIPTVWTCIGNTRHFSVKSSPDRAGKSDSKSSAAVAESDIFGETSNLGLFAKFKLMYKKYWYVLIPVHVVTSIGWLGGFYYLSKSGVDVPALLQYIHLSETIIQKVQNSDMGHYAIAYLCYKVATPLRYAVTLGGTTVSIKYLVQMGHIKPMPSKQEFIDMYEQKKADRAAAKAEKDKN